jgi:hypothetical protein
VEMTRGNRVAVDGSRLGAKGSTITTASTGNSRDGSGNSREGSVSGKSSVEILRAGADSRDETHRSDWATGASGGIQVQTTVMVQRDDVEKQPGGR